MRRPPDTQPPTSNEVASSNSTLNAFLGGRQKSWMTVGNSTVRPTPRDPTRASTSSAASLQRNSAATVLPSPAPSDEPSPVQHQNESPAAEIPSEQMHQASTHQPQPQQQHTPLQQQQQSPQQQHQSPQLQQHQSPQQQHQSPQVQQSPPQPQNLQQQQHPQQQSNRQPQPTMAPFPQAQHHSPYTAQIQGQHQDKRRRTAKPVTVASGHPTLTSRVTMIDEHIRVCGFNNLNVPIERPRFSLLREACTMDDFFYVALHQIFCTWSVNQNAVLALPDLNDPETLATAFKILSQLIRDNSGLTFSHLEWFTKFPAPLQSLVASSDVYKKNLASVSVFLRRLRSDWGPLTLKCQERGYPPLCDELVTTLNLVSPVLQNVFFTATRRNLSIEDDRFGHAMEGLFVKDRTEFQLLASRMNTNRPPSEKEMLARKDKLVREYMSLNSQRIAEQNTNRLLQPAPQPPAAQRSSYPVPSNGTPVLQHQHSRSNSYTHAPAAQSQYAQQEPNTNGQNPHASPFPPHRVPSVQQYDATHSPNQAYMAPGHVPTVSAGYAYTPGVVPSNVGSSIDGNYPGYYPGPQNGYSGQPQQQVQVQVGPQVSQQHARQQSWIREFQQAHEQDQHIRQVLQQQQQQQQQQLQQHQQQVVQQQAVRPQNMMHRQTHIRGGLTINPAAPTSRNNSVVGSPYPQNASAFPVLTSTPNGTVRKEDDMFIPPAGVMPLNQNQPPRPDLTALHQAPVRSPRLQTAGLLNSKVPTSSEERFYQAVKGFVIQPVALPKDRTLSTYEFALSEATWANVARTMWPSPGELATRNVSGGSLQYRFRCVQLGPDNKVPSDNDWINADTRWPEALFIEVNSTQLELRRKYHHGKDLPVDITQFVKPTERGSEGLNTVRVSHIRTKRQGEPNYAIAIEVTEVLQHRAIMDMVLRRQRIPESETLENIMAKLSVSMDDDDEIAMIASDLTIDLADPFTSKIFEVPVRGVTCLHRECFDLETFLMTRISKPKRPEQPCMVDVWKCPLCSRDVRPYSLRVDEFLLSVRNSLAEQNLLDCKAILVSADGTWRAKPEPKPTGTRNKRNASSAGMDDDDTDDEDENKRTPAASKGPEPEVIELDSD